ncbi:hypothetical protein GQ53DRAFT_858570 [Thozetella sp. PMI_491]|nr:hypothetical protein GQ53DRAFT_858570 [Thozetella sp. PMI_491]
MSSGPIDSASAAGSTPRSDSAPVHSPIAAGSRSQNATTAKKRSIPPPTPPGTTSATDSGENRRKTPKVSRACDFCKTKKLRCSGTLPCSTCVKRSLACVYDAKYSRGRPPTPQPATTTALLPTITSPAATPQIESNSAQTTPRADLGTRSEQATLATLGNAELRTSLSRASPTPYEDVAPSRSPELDTSEIDGQFFEPTSGVAFLHEASRRLLLQRRAAPPPILTGGERSQLLMTAGDPPLLHEREASFQLPPDPVARELVEFYFDSCVVTYRIFHRQSVVGWAEAMLSNSRHNQPLTYEIGHARASIVLTIFAIVTFRRGRIEGGHTHCTVAQAESDGYFDAGLRLTDAETGLPGLVSAQARLIQVLYLLQTSRMNQAWYRFGMTSQITSALGLYRRSRRKRNGSVGYARGDYIETECSKRTFWVAYTIDRYLTVVFGRPRQYHDEDIDQSFPENINDESMTIHGPSGVESPEECHVVALVLHAKLAQIIGVISRDVYSVKRLPKSQRISSAQNALAELHSWRASLPPHLGTVKPSTLIPIFRRQAIALNLAYAHAIIHVTRPFLLGRWGNSSREKETVRSGIEECISAAKAALQTFDTMVTDGSLFHAFWWTSYVAFCALAVVYILDIQLNSTSNRDFSAIKPLLSSAVLELAEKCRGHLSSSTMTDTPSHRYSIILEGLRNGSKQQHGGHSRPPLDEPRLQTEPENDTQASNSTMLSTGLLEDNQFLFQKIFHPGEQLDGSELDGMDMDPLVSGWQTTDWLELDASVCSAQSTGALLLHLLTVYPGIGTIQSI